MVHTPPLNNHWLMNWDTIQSGAMASIYWQKFVPWISNRPLEAP